MYQVQRTTPTPIFCLYIVKWKLEKSASQDIIIIGLASLTIVHNRKVHVPFFESSVFFPCGWALYLHPTFQPSRQTQCFQGLTYALGSAVYAHPARTGGKFCAGFRPSSSIFCLPLRFTSVLPPQACWKLTRSLNFLYQIFSMVLFLCRCLSFTIFLSLWLCNTASVFLFILIIADLFLYIYSGVYIFYGVMKFEFNLFL